VILFSSWSEYSAAIEQWAEQEMMMMQMLPFYDEGAIRTLRDFEELVYQNVR